MKGFYRKLFVIGFFLFLFNFFALAQRSNGLTIEGRVSVQQGLVQGAVIEMVQDGRKLDNYGIGPDGRFKVELNYNHKFELNFVLRGNYSQKILVETNVPREVLQTDPLFPPFPLNINLFTEVAGIDKSFSENPVLKIYYRNQIDNFVADVYYNDAQIKRIIDQAILQSQMVSREADYLSKLTKAELAEMRREFDQLLKEADADYGKENFLNALDAYKAANKVFPNEQYPKDRIDEINDLLGLLMVAAEMDKALAERFNSLITEADQNYNVLKYFEARNLYQRALSIRPADNHANQRVKQINDILVAQQVEQQYQDLIMLGNNAFNEMLYEAALGNYNEASALKPNEEYPKTRIREINQKLAELSKNLENQTNYEQAIFQAELNFERQFYDRSLASYENALSYKPGDSKATARISEIKDLMNRLANRTMYDRLIETADRNFKRNLFPEALADYRKAIELFPDEKHPAQQIATITERLEGENNFLAIISQADNAFTAKLYQDAKDFYSQALALRSTHKHSSDRVAEINRILASLSVDENYNALIAQADDLFAGKDYNEAKNKYTEASTVKTREQYPKDRITEINTILRDIAATDQKYQLAISRADNMFNSARYSEAKPLYAEAGTIKPNESYPPEMIKRIDSLMEEQALLLAKKEAEEKARQESLVAERDRNYQAIIDEADRLVDNKELVEAVGKFRSALDVKPNEQYPIQRIEEIRGMIARQQEMLDAYKAAIARADAEFNRESFDAAKTAYNTAKSVKSDETYPDEQIARIDSIVETRARLAAEAEAAELARLAALQAEKDRQYSESIARADGLFNGREYENARTEYRSALIIKPEESYPQQKIDEIGNLLAQLSAAQKAYEEAIAAGDREFNRESFDASKTAYNTAKSVKSDETYPDEQIARIDSIVETRARLAAEAEAAEQARLAALQAEKDRQYSESIARADGLFNGREYENARTEYRSALTIKPEESYPQQKIDEIGNLLAQLSAAQKAYEDAIAAGDHEFNRESFDAAKTAYNTAKSAKSDETYPDEQIARIDSIVGTRARLAAEADAAEQARLTALQAEKDRQYSESIARADGLFNGREYENARTEYRSALTIKPEESYPQQKISEINSLLEQQAQLQRDLEILNRNYANAIQVADNYFKSGSFPLAKDNYEKALALKPEENYPKQRISEIENLLQQQQVDENYRKIILVADGYFNTTAYNEAKSEYDKALDVKPNEQYPKNQIQKINDIFQKESQRLLAEQKAAEDLERRRTEIQQQNNQVRELEIVSQAGLDNLYNQYISEADSHFDTREYNVSRGWYYKAWDLKPKEAYPQERIAEINRLVSSMLSTQRDRDYQNFINLGDSTFRDNQLAVARGWYNQALSIKGNESYPREQLTEIDRLVNERLAGRSGELFNEHVEKAAAAFESGSISVARFWYKKALELRPDDATVKNRLNEIEAALK